MNNEEAVAEYTADVNRLSARSTTCNKLMLGLTVVMIALTALSIYLTYTDLVNYYKVDFVPIPRYMIDEKDLIGYNSKGEKIVLKNQSAYYKAILCNRSEKEERQNRIVIKQPPCRIRSAGRYLLLYIWFFIRRTCCYTAPHTYR